MIFILDKGDYTMENILMVLGSYISLAEIIQILVSIISLNIALGSMYQSKKSIQLTESSILNVNRPYVMIYIETLDTVYFEKYIVIKNFGKSAAKIIDLNFTSKLDSNNDTYQMKSLVGGIIAPNQKYTTTMDSSFNEEVTGRIRYQSMENFIYEEDFSIKTDMSSQLLWSNRNNNKDGDEAAAIKQASQNIIKAFK